MVDVRLESILEQRLTRVILIVSYSSFFIASTIMILWFIEPSLIQSLLPVSATTKFNTALLFGGLSLYLILHHQKRFQVQQWLPFISLGILLISITTLLADIFHFNLFLDELFVSDPLTIPNGYPGRMSEMTTVLFIILSVALLIFHHYPRLAEWLAISANLTALVALLGFLFDFDALYSIIFFNTVSIFTASLFVILSGVIILSIPQSIIRNLILLDQPAGMAMRWLLPIILIVPTLFSWIILQGMNQELYEPTFALVLVTILTVTIQLLMVIAYALTIQFTYQKQQTLQRRLLQSQLDSEIESIELKNMQALNTMKEEFFVMLAHDMRTPITTIVTSSDILMHYNKQLTEERRVEHLRKIKHQAYNVLDFVDDMTLLSHFQLGQIPYSPVSADLATFCRQYHAEFTEIYDLKEHNLVLEVPEKSVELAFDHKLVKRLLSNLIGNALKYSPNGGTVILHVEEGENRVHLWVKDEGMGIPETELNTLFELFQRATNVENIKGYGLGLAIVKQIVAVHDATITVQSKVGKGSTFMVAFPMV